MPLENGNRPLVCPEIPKPPLPDPSVAIIEGVESRSGFDRLLGAYRKRFAPEDVVEADLIEQVASASWRLRRAMAVESQLLRRAAEEIPRAHGRPRRMAWADRTAAAMGICRDRGSLLTAIQTEIYLAGRHYRDSLDALLRLRREITPPPRTGHGRGGDQSRLMPSPKSKLTEVPKPA